MRYDTEVWEMVGDQIHRGTVRAAQGYLGHYDRLGELLQKQGEAGWQLVGTVGVGESVIYHWQREHSHLQELVEQAAPPTPPPADPGDALVEAAWSVVGNYRGNDVADVLKDLRTACAELTHAQSLFDNAMETIRNADFAHNMGTLAKEVEALGEHLDVHYTPGDGEGE